MLLQPRKYIFKHNQKKRVISTFKKKYLKFGEIGFRLLSSLLIDSKQIFRLKLFLKKASRKAEITKRKVWVHAFPHLPLSKKSKGLRMGKGVGRLDIWFTKFKAGIFFIEFRNLRLGRIIFFLKQINSKLLSIFQ